MEQVYVTERDQWRTWLSRHHDSSPGIWLIFYKKATSRPTIDYEAAVEEALCFGWIDSILKRLDEERYVRKFTPRKAKSNWSAHNRKRATRMIKAGRMTDVGLAKIKAAKKSGLWNKDGRPKMSLEVPAEFARALAGNTKAKEHFEKLAPSYRKFYIYWVAAAKRPETKKKRIDESLALLEQGKKLGMK
ncbi:MAG: YdeI/OmpD-associated family protein [Planctomycetota bacterium]|jgi:uncharacterized protein YdeI (YjbR/CyaY-like superfamily)